MCMDCREELKLDLEVLSTLIEVKGATWINYGHARNLLDFFGKFLPILIDCKKKMRSTSFGTRMVTFSLLLYLFFSFPSAAYIYGILEQFWNFFDWSQSKPDLYALLVSNTSSMIEDVGEISLSILARRTANSFNTRTEVKHMSERYLQTAMENLPSSTNYINRTQCSMAYSLLRGKTLCFFQDLVLKIGGTNAYAYLPELPPRMFKYSKPIPINNLMPKEIFLLKTESIHETLSFWSKKFIMLLESRQKRSIKPTRSRKRQKTKDTSTSESSEEENIFDGSDEEDSEEEEIYAILGHNTLRNAAGEKYFEYYVEWLEATAGKNSKGWVLDTDILYATDLLSEYWLDPKDMSGD